MTSEMKRYPWTWYILRKSDRNKNSRYSKGDSMREHLARMVEIKEQLAKMDYSLLDKSFVSYIRTLISLPPNFWSLITTLNASAHETRKKLTRKNLIWHLNEEPNSIVLKESINKSNEAMLAATSKAKGGKEKEKAKQTNVKCSNCNKPNHTIDKC
jgi:phage terminase small subunit